MYDCAILLYEVEEQSGTGEIGNYKIFDSSIFILDDVRIADKSIPKVGITSEIHLGNAVV